MLAPLSKSLIRTWIWLYALYFILIYYFNPRDEDFLLSRNSKINLS